MGRALSVAATVLKISEIPKAEGTWLQLEGSLAGSWVEELRQVVEEALAQSAALTLDLEHLWYMDREGAALVRELMTRQVVPVNGSPFINRQLQTTAGDNGALQ